MRSYARAGLIVTVALCLTSAGMSAGQNRPASASRQRLDEEYTKRILASTPDKRILTELVDHMPLPADAKVPSPLKFLGYIPGENGMLTYHRDIVRYLEALQQASPRVKLWTIGKTEEGRDMVACAIADEATIKNLQRYKNVTAQLTDPRKTNDSVAKELIATGKPIYYITGSIHTPEPGSPEMLMELAYRLAIEDSPYIQEIRNNVIVVFTPVTEVDGRERLVDGQRAVQAGQPNPGLLYWGRYVQHDNNRDGIGKGLALTNNLLKSFLDLHPTVFHDLHESVDLLHVSTGTGPYNPIVAPIQVTEWWWLSQNEVMELTKRGVPGVWTYNYYDGWVPNYLFWIGVTHNSIGRFYETQSYPRGGAGRGTPPAGAGAADADGAATNAPAPVQPVAEQLPQPAAPPPNCGRPAGPNSTFPPANSREWYRPYPNPGCIEWSGRSNVNMQQSALLVTLNLVARNREKLLENYYAKNRMMIEQGSTTAPYAYIIPAKQRKAVEAADLMNLIRREGAEVHTATSAFTVGASSVAPGDYIVRMDQPYRGVVETLLGVQWYPAENPRPYDDTGWNIPVMRNVTAHRIDAAAVLSQPMALATADFTIPGTITGSGRTLVVDHTTENTLVTFRFQNKDVAMAVAEQPFDMNGHHFAAGALVIADANRAALAPQIRELGLSAWATDTLPAVPTHRMTLPRIGYLHSWTSTQDEGWVRMALDRLKVPYDYFGDNLARNGNLRAKYDVLIYPSTTVNVAAERMPTGNPVPYKATTLTPNIGTAPDHTDDTRGGLGRDGLRELAKFVSEGGLLITEGATSSVLPENGVTPGLTIDQGGNLFAPGSVIKALIADPSSPVLYGYDQNAIGVMYKNGPLFGLAAKPHPPTTTGPAPTTGRGATPVGGGSMQPMAAPPRLTTLERGPAAAQAAQPTGGRGGGGRGGGPGANAPAGRGGGATATRSEIGIAATAPPRVLLSYPESADDLLLSGALSGGENLAGRPVLVDVSIGQGHAVMFASRPFWRNQTQGNFFLAFNAILNWDHLDAGRAPAAR
jgi:hypothetical protein